MSSQVILREQHGSHLRLTSFFLGKSSSWDEVWTPYSPKGIRVVKEYFRHFSILLPTLLDHLPRDGPIIEAGSGLGFWVALLNEAGHEVWGLDRSDPALELARRTFPDLRFDRGDVLELPYEDRTLAGYVSFGVAEHFREGPQAVLREAARVLRRGGVLYLTVPWISPLRRVQPFRPTAVPHDSEFYQYFFGRTELEAVVAASGFRLRAFHTYATLKTFLDEFRTLRQRFLPRRPDQAVRPHKEAVARPNEPDVNDVEPKISWARQLFWRTQNLILENAPLRRFAGHMAIVIAERE